MSIFRRRPDLADVHLPERDAIILDKYTRRMKRFDEMIKVCCCWIGYDILLEFIPIVGKVISLMFAMSMYKLACQADLPRSIKQRMLYHITVDFLLGLIPILGILLDILYRAHSKNTRILKQYLYERARNGSAEAEKKALNITKVEKQPLTKPTSEMIMDQPQ
ncbi:hypothetical protein K501DRAFT_245067 [Backusella circina FSU 941]|nr:hypothetical protein K501DRAFT_245067 [Backusella circina FSU 941]